MKTKSQSLYPPHQFAKKACVTVRTLHHYDRLGLLKPSDRTGAGFRLYGERDFARLQQIVTLKFIGFPLKQIQRLLDRKGSDLPMALRLQRKTLEEKRRHLDSAIQAIARAEHLAASGGEPGWETFQKIIEVIHMQTNPDWTKQYYNDEAQKLIAERQKLWNPELQKKAEQDWTALIKDIESAAAEGVDPASPRAQALAERQAKLIEGFTGGHKAIEEGLGKLWADQPNWTEAATNQVFEPMAQHGVPAAQGAAPKLFTDRADAFIQKAVAARNAKK